MVDTKLCKFCGEVRSTKRFKVRSDNGKLNNKCIDCVRIQSKEYYKRNKGKLRAQNDLWRANNLDDYKEYQASYREQNRLSARQYAKAYREVNKDAIKDYMTQYYCDNKKIIIDQHNDYIKKRSIKDINFRLGRNLRSRLYQAIKNGKKSGSAEKDLGCTIDFLKAYLESLFYSGMSWDNYGYWHIDHIIPLSKFDLSNKEELQKACHYTNLQPLWSRDNLAKGAR